MHCVQKELDTFPSTYAKDYIWHNTHPEFHSSSGFDAYALTKDEKKSFIDLNAVKNLPWEEQVDIIKNLYAKRMKSTYYVSYCEDAKRKLTSGNEENRTDNDTLLTLADNLYTKKTQNILEPVPTSRRVMGYCRPAYYYTGMSEYQDVFGRTGYQQLAPARGSRLQQHLSFCDQFKSRH